MGPRRRAQDKELLLFSSGKVFGVSIQILIFIVPEVELALQIAWTGQPSGQPSWNSFISLCIQSQNCVSSISYLIAILVPEEQDWVYRSLSTLCCSKAH